MINKILFYTALVLSSISFAETAFKGESEASAVIVSGNVDTETIGAKTKNTWNFTELDLATVFGRYMTTKTAGTTTGKAWDAGLRYERTIVKDVFSGFVQQMAEHDPYNGVFIQRDSTDIGGKYFFTKSDDLTWLAELGYRYTSTYEGLLNSDKTTANYVRLYTELAHKLNTTTSGKVWAEYLQDTKNSDQSLWNAEASLTVAMSTMFSLKTAYLIKHTEGAVAPAKKDTTTWTTALIANY